MSRAGPGGEGGKGGASSKFFYSHLTDAIRLVLLWKYGGIYVDFDFIVLKVCWNCDSFSHFFL